MSRIHLALHKVHEARVHDLTIALRTVRFRPHVKGANREASLGTGARPSAFPVAEKRRYIVLARLGRLRTDIHPYLEHLVGFVNVVKAPSDFHPALIGAHALSRQALSRQLTRQLHAILDVFFGAARGCRLNRGELGLFFHRCHHFAPAAVVQTLFPFVLVVLIHRKGSNAHLVANGQQFHQGTCGILRGILFLKGLRARIIDVDGHDRIRRDVGFGLSIEEPSILLDNRLIKDVLFSVDVARVLEGCRKLFAFQAPMTENLLVFRGQHQIGALNVNTVLDGTLKGAFLVLVGRRTQGDEEAKGAMVRQIVKVGQIADVFMEKRMDMRDFKLALNGPLNRVFEVQINQNRRLKITAALFHQIKGAALLREQVFVEKVKEVGVVVVLDHELASHGAHSSERAGVTLLCDAVGVEKQAEAALEKTVGVKHGYTIRHPFLGLSIFTGPLNRSPCRTLYEPLRIRGSDV